MFLVVCEGILRKLIPSLQTQIYLLKDAMLVLAYIGFMKLSTGKWHSSKSDGGAEDVTVVVFDLLWTPV